MPNIGAVSRRAQNLLVGADFIKITGLSPSGVKATPTGDRGAVYTGVQGDTMLEEMVVSSYDLTVGLLPTSPGIDILINLADTVVFFPVKFELGSLVLEGYGILKNEGEASGAQGDAERTMIIAFARQAGQLGSIGTTLANA